jgi:hypothetical protein
MESGAFGSLLYVGATDDGVDIGESVVGSSPVGSLEIGGSENGASDVGTRDPANIGTLAGEYDEGYALTDGTREYGASDEGLLDPSGFVVGEVLTFTDVGTKTGISKNGELVVGPGNATTTGVRDGLKDTGIPNVVGGALFIG